MICAVLMRILLKIDNLRHRLDIKESVCGAVVALEREKMKTLTKLFDGFWSVFGNYSNRYVNTVTHNWFQKSPS